ncbi:hypothetical protein R1flu_000856 [Riccia fluitans]|uniref:Uncharacterized protein n=1 Tax=Riccia fluitans TaxID=41844 RepID=A0ABD1Y1L8_9MARC
MDHRIQYVKSDATFAREAWDKAWAEAKRLKEDLERTVENHRKIMEVKSTELRELLRKHNLLTTPEEPRATDLVLKLAEELRAAKRGTDGKQHLVAEKDEELEKLKAELEKIDAD